MNRWLKVKRKMHYTVNRSWFVWYLEKEMGLASISVKILLYWIQILVQVHKKKTRFKKKRRCIIACYQCYVQNIDSNISLPKVFGLLWNSSYRTQVPKHAYIISFHIQSNTSVFFFQTYTSNFYQGDLIAVLDDH